MKERKRRENIFSNKAIYVAKNNLTDIKTVGDWANEMGYSRSYFYALFTKLFEKTPGKTLRKIRYQAICLAIIESPSATSYKIAKEVGLKDEDSVYKFLKKHYDTNFGNLRYEILEKVETF